MHVDYLLISRGKWAPDSYNSYIWELVRLVRLLRKLHHTAVPRYAQPLQELRQKLIYMDGLGGHNGINYVEEINRQLDAETPFGREILAKAIEIELISKILVERIALMNISGF